MDFDLTEEQRQLADSLARLLQDHYDFETRAKRLASPSGANDTIWQHLAELGLFSLPLSEAAGGFGGGAVDLMEPLALLGRALAVEPVTAHLTACRLVDSLTGAPPGSGSGLADQPEPVQADAVLSLLEGCATGAHRLAWARVDASGDSGAADPLRLEDGLLHGTRVDVEGADRADWLVVNLAGEGGEGEHEPTVYLLPTASPGLAIRTSRLLDNRQVSEISFNGVAVTGTAPTGRIGPAGPPARQAIKAALDFSSALICAEAMGIIDFACETTLDYLKTRQQFGVPIGSFQALQHRIVDLYVEREQVRSMTALACSRVDGASSGQINASERARAVAAARVYLARATRLVAQESVQLHGGMGMAEELKISHAFRRLTLIGRQGGHESTYLDRFIRLSRPAPAAGVDGTPPARAEATTA